MDIADFKQDLKRNKGKRFTDRQLDIADKLYESGYTFEVIGFHMNTDKANLRRSLNRYRLKASACAALSDNEIGSQGVGPWYAQSEFYGGKPVNEMGRE